MRSQLPPDENARRVPRIAVTGGIACGKSEFGRALSSLGVEVVDADEVVRVLQQPGCELALSVEKAFGSGYLASDGSVNRRKLANLVFSDKKALDLLNSISHPSVRVWLRGWAEKETAAPLKAALVPLLFEKGWEKDWDATVCVACAAQTQKTRLASRGLNEEEIRSRLASQWNQERKMKSADIVVMNDGGLETLREEAARVIKMILEKKNNE